MPDVGCCAVDGVSLKARILAEMGAQVRLQPLCLRYQRMSLVRNQKLT